jgi:hypothetical protein
MSQVGGWGGLLLATQLRDTNHGFESTSASCLQGTWLAGLRCMPPNPGGPRGPCLLLLPWLQLHLSAFNEPGPPVPLYYFSLTSLFCMGVPPCCCGWLLLPGAVRVVDALARQLQLVLVTDETDHGSSSTQDPEARKEHMHAATTDLEADFGAAAASDATGLVQVTRVTE